jgi:hypothetical protein
MIGRNIVLPEFEKHLEDVIGCTFERTIETQTKLENNVRFLTSPFLSLSFSTP